MSTCQGCDEPIQQPRYGRRKWCSDRCRKATLYSGTCTVCGGPTNGSNGPDTAADRCGHCAARQHDERAGRILALWNAGVSGERIARQLGLSFNTVRSTVEYARARGRDVAQHALPKRGAEERRREIAQLVGQGVSNADIAQRLGYASAESVAHAIYSMRKKGHAVPERDAAPREAMAA